MSSFPLNAPKLITLAELVTGFSSIIAAGKIEPVWDSADWWTNSSSIEKISRVTASALIGCVGYFLMLISVIQLADKRLILPKKDWSSPLNSEIKALAVTSLGITAVFYSYLLLTKTGDKI